MVILAVANALKHTVVPDSMDVAAKMIVNHLVVAVNLISKLKLLNVALFVEALSYAALPAPSTLDAVIQFAQLKNAFVHAISANPLSNSIAVADVVQPVLTAKGGTAFPPLTPFAPLMLEIVNKDSIYVTPVDTCS